MPIIPPSASSGSGTSTQSLPKTAFGELQTANLRTVSQLTATYGLLPENLRIIQIAGAVASSSNQMFVCETNTHPAGLATIQSQRQLSYKAGQGGLARFTALFTQGVTNSAQIAGLFHSEDRLCFGYNGTEFGILYAYGGKTEAQELQVTTAATGSETATVTVNNIPFSVPLTAGTVQHNAYEIATSLSSQDPGHLYASVGDTIYCTSILDGAEGTFAFSSSTAVATWTQIIVGASIIENWTPQTSWNVNTKVDLDPTKGNVYQIQYQYLGFGAIKFSVEDPKTGQFVLVHTIEYANSATVPSVSNPTFRIGWACQNRGNTSNLTVKGASAAIFIEGDGLQSDDTRGVSANANGIGLTETTLLTLRNTNILKGRINRQEIVPLLLSMSTDTTKSAIFTIRKNPIITGDLIFQREDDESLLEYATDNRSVSGGKTLFEFTITKEGSPSIDLEDKLLFLPSDVITISSRVSSGSVASMQAAFSYRQDF